MIDPAQLTPLHDRLIVKHLREQVGRSLVIRENPNLVDFVGQGENGEHNDNRRVAVRSVVVSIGAKVRGVKVGDCILHTAWNDFPEWFNREIGEEYALIRQNDVMGHLDVAKA